MSGFTFDWYIKLFHNKLILRSLLNTMIVAVIASIGATVLGTAAAVGINSMKRLMRFIANVLIFTPKVSLEILLEVQEEE